MKQRKSRREFLISSLQSLGALGLGPSVIGSLIGTVYERAMAEGGYGLALNPKGYRYVFVSLPGAPPRWYFDMLPTPKGTGPGSETPYGVGGFGNALDISGSTIQVVNGTYEYKYGDAKKIFLPPVWGMGTDTHDFTSLLPHTLFVRGMDMEINNHGLSNTRQVAPILGGNSLHGVIADKMGSPVAAVLTGAPSGAAFKSAKGLGPVVAAGTGNPITALIAPFATLPNTLVFRRSEVAPVVDQFLDRMDSYAELHRITPSALRKAHEAADHLITLNIDMLKSAWDGILQRYTNILNVAMHPAKGQLPGVFDKVVPKITGDGRFRYDGNDPNKLLTLSDGRDLIAADTGKADMARWFALSEFLLVTGISSVVDVNAGGFILAGAQVTDAGAKSVIAADQHGVGSVTSTIATTIYYRGLLAAMTELVSVLKTQNLFKNTIIHVSAEFNRIPRADGSGSDHGVGGSSATLISGMFQEVAYIGNIQKNGVAGSAPGSWGLAAPWEFEDGLKRPIKVNDIARSITAMTNSADVVANGYSLVRPLEDGVWAPKVAGGKNV